MNYKESRLILKEVEKAKRILLNCHRGPDPDAIGSSLALYKVLNEWDKEVDIVCVSDELFDNVSFLSGYSKIKKGVDFSTLNFSKYDLFITLDSSSWEMVAGNNAIPIPNIPIVVIDHHKTNSKYGTINLVDKKTTSTAEILYLLFKDWSVKLDRETATDLLAGIVGDTGAFRFPGSTEKTFNIASELMLKGANKDKIILRIYRSEPFKLIKFYGEVLSRMNLDKKGKFVWVALPNDVYKKLDKPQSARESSASMFLQIVEGTRFGFVAVEEQRDVLAVSFRSRTGFDTSEIAEELGGGGHIYASGAKIKGMKFEKAVEKVLKIARKYAKSYKK